MSEWDNPGPGGGGGGILAAFSYAPAALATYAAGAGLTALVWPDTTPMRVGPFEVPPSELVLVQFVALVDAEGGNTTLGFGLLNHAGGAQIGKTRETTAISAPVTVVVPFLLSAADGLVAGEELTLDLAVGATAGGSVYAMGHVGAVSAADAGPALLVVSS